jgi:DNA-binding MarR family transcriptional regulator
MVVTPNGMMHTHQMTSSTPLPPADLPCACTTLRKASRAVARLYEGHLAEAGLSATQFAILRALERRGTSNLRPLADELVMERTSLYRAITPLERSGLVATEAAAGDARARRATLTDNGRERIAAALPHWEAAQRAFIEGFGAGDYGGFIDELRRAIAQVEPATRGRTSAGPDSPFGANR